MTARKWFVPTEGMTIPDPQTRTVCPPKGMWVRADDEYWMRRELDGGGTRHDASPPGAEIPDASQPDPNTET